MAKLTRRETEVLKLVAIDGMCYQDIADKMMVEMCTVRTYALRIREKMGSHLLTQAVYKATKEGLI